MGYPVSPKKRVMLPYPRTGTIQDLTRNAFWQWGQRMQNSGARVRALGAMPG